MRRINMTAARKAAELTQMEVSTALGVSKGTISAWETGKSEPTISQFRRLCALYGFSEDDIILPEKYEKIGLEAM